MVTAGRADYGSEFLYNKNEQATNRAYQVGLYGDMHFDNGGKLTGGLSYELSHWLHDSLSFSRNIIDQDGEGFEPWYPNGQLHSVNISLRYDQPLLSWLRVHAEGYNSLLHFKPTTREWSNAIYMQRYDDTTRHRFIPTNGKRLLSSRDCWRTRPWSSPRNIWRRVWRCTRISASRWTVSC